ncbi:MAG: wax ester/triacylglycerol synthase family O-acyltransferase [Candidatus Hydrogenedentota bacterium]
MPDSNGKLSQRLSAMDAFFLYLEAEEQPMHVGAVCLFEGRLPYAQFVKTLESRLHMVPRYRQRALIPPFNIGHPVWQEDPHFDIRNHIFRLKLPAPGTDEELRKLSGQILTGALDRNKPLWEIYFVEGLTGKRTALVVKVHHCMVDGVAGIGLALVLLDVVPNPPKTRKPPYKPGPLPDTGQLMYDALWDNMIEGVRHWTRWQRSAAAYARGFERRDILRNVKKFSETMGRFLLPYTRMPFNKPLSGERILLWRDYAFADARAIRAVVGGTVNDVILTVLSSAVRELHKVRRQERRIPPSLRVLVPVNVRRETERASLGNHISLMPVEVPLMPGSAVERLQATSVRMRELKEAKVADAISLMFDVFQGAPALLQHASLRAMAKPGVQTLLDRLAGPVPPANLICTNVPGPQIPLYVCGHRLTAMYPTLPVALEMGINLAITSYDQKLCITFVGDQVVADDMNLLADYFDAAFRELRDAAAVKESQYVEITRRAREEETAL